MSAEGSAAGAGGAGAGAGAASSGAVEVDAACKAFFAHIDAHAEEYVAGLAELCAIKGVSADPTLRPEVLRTMTWMKERIETTLGASVEMKDIGTQTLPDGTELPLPPVIFAHLEVDPGKPTLLVYGHLDVQPAKKEDGWNTDPWVLTEVDGALFGRGSTDDKGPMLCWLWALKAMKELGQDIPVNIKMCLEGMEESSSVGLDACIDREIAKGDKSFFAGVDAVCISDNYWLGTRKPCITYGLRGIVKFHLKVKCGTKDLHSGVHGGVVHEAVFDCMKLMSSLLNDDGSIAVAGMQDEVDPMTDAERATFPDLDFDVDTYRGEIGVAGALNYKSKQDVLTHRWRYPSLSLHGMEGAYSEPGFKTVIPREVIGKFSVRIVPSMTPEHVEKVVQAHIEAQVAKIGTPNTVELIRTGGAAAWVADFDHPNFVAGRRATKMVHGIDPDLTREGGSIPITLKFEEATGKNVLLLPVGRSDDMAHSQNEKLDRSNYINGIKLLGAYIKEFAKIAGDIKE